MAYVNKLINEIKANPGTCIFNAKKDLQQIAEKLKVSKSGNISDICKRITSELAKQRSYVPAPRPLAGQARQPRAARDVIEIDMDDDIVDITPRKPTTVPAIVPRVVVPPVVPRFDFAIPQPQAPRVMNAIIPKLTPMSPKALQNIIKDNKTFGANVQAIKQSKSKAWDCPNISNADGSKYTWNTDYLKSTIRSDYAGLYVGEPKQDLRNMQYIQCYVREILSRSNNLKYTNEQKIQVLLEDIKKYLYIQKIGSDETGSYGTVFRVWAKDTKGNKIEPPFGILKVTQGSEDDGEIFHELAIGFALNKVREKVPNFSYTYDGFYCDANQKQSYLKCSSDANPKDLMTFSIQQLVPYSLPITKMNFTSPDVARKIIKRVLLQVGHALNVAQKMYKYMHFDLHESNVMIRKLEKPIPLVNIKDEGNYDINMRNVDYIPVIIDYGMNTITESGQIICRDIDASDSPRVMQDAGCKSSYFSPGFDIYRYMIACLQDFYKKYKAKNKKEFLDVISNIYFSALGPFMKRKKYARTQTMKELLSADNIKELHEALEESEEIGEQSYGSSASGTSASGLLRFGSYEDREVFNVSMDDWISYFSNHVD